MLAALAVAVVLAAGTALVAAAGQLAGDIALDESAVDDGANDTDPANRTIPGIEDDGTANVSSVLESHRSILVDSGYLAVTNATLSRNGSVVATEDQSIRSSPNASRVRVERDRRGNDGADATTGDPAASTTVWSNDSYTVTRERSDGRERVNVEGRVPMGAVPPTAGPFTTAFGRVDGEFTVTDDRVIDGHRLVTIEAPLEPTTNDTDPGRLRLTVDDRGVVRNGSATWERPDGRIELSYRLVSLGVEDVSKPGWAETVMNESDHPTNGTATASERESPIAAG